MRLQCGAYYSNCAVIGHFTCQMVYVTGLGGMSYCNQTLFLSGRVGSGDETRARGSVHMGWGRWSHDYHMTHMNITWLSHDSHDYHMTHMSITWLSHDSHEYHMTHMTHLSIMTHMTHMSITWLTWLHCRLMWSWARDRMHMAWERWSHDYHMTITWLSHDSIHMTITWLHVHSRLQWAFQKFSMQKSLQGKVRF